MEGTENSNTQTAPGEGANGPAPDAAGQATTPAAAASAPAKPAKAAKSDKKKAGTAEEAAADPAANPNPKTVEVWPLRSYQDAGEIKRRGGKSYSVTKRHADALIARGLATDEEPTKANTKADK